MVYRINGRFESFFGITTSNLIMENIEADSEDKAKEIFINTMVNKLNSHDFYIKIDNVSLQ